ncbi:hypothetical protein KIH74_34815 [Kineosporia sp. J2-2]|uniref:DUF4240 domain-containing protein n=1 Tax=Kineosporia corallincola TaxID=2835133 RepID=A0ABS5TTS7_9ACTN|nr:hypothetical protein [Kineosporia corallincola]MBT0774170.1 hypothetical protein [Kineosporia corallincola]
MDSKEFWAIVQRQLDDLCTARTGADVLRILSRQQAAAMLDGATIAGDGFFAGSGGDGTVMESLTKAGWSIDWIRASYYWAMRCPDGREAITYVEGDIYPGTNPLPMTQEKPQPEQ